MAEDIRIKVFPTVDKGDSTSELSNIIKDLEKNAKKIKIGIDDKELLSEIAKLKEQINTLSKGTNNKGNSKMFQGETDSAKKLISEYKKLISEKSKLERQMSKQTYKGQAYKTLSKDLTKVNSQIKKVGDQIDGLNKKNIKSDITSSLVNSFETTIKKANELGTALQNALGKRNLTGAQTADIKTLQRQVESFKSTANLDNILKADKPYAEMSKLMTRASELSTSFKKLELSDSLSKSIRKAESDVSILQNKIKSLYTKGYGNSNAIDRLFEKSKNLQKINIRVNSADAESKLLAFTKDIEKLEAEYNKLDATMKKQKQTDVFKINVSATLKNLENIRAKFVEVGKDVSQLDNLKSKIQSLNNLSLSEAQKEFSKIKKEVNELSSEVPKAVSAMTRYNKLMSERASLEKQMSKTTNTQSYDVLNRKLEENLANIKKVSAELDTLKNKNINPDITKSLASAFDSLQKSATNTSQKLDNMFKNKNLTGDQVKQLESLRKEMVRIQGTKLDNILNISSSHEHMSNLFRDLQNVNTLAKELDINGNFNAKIESAYKKIQELGTQIEKLKSVKGFLDTTDLQNRLQQVTKLFNSDLKNAKINIETDTAVADLKRLTESIELAEREVTELTNISNSSKKAFDFSTNVNSSLTKINEFASVLKTLGKDTTEIEKLKAEFQNLSNIPIQEAESKLKRLNNEMNNMFKNTTGIKTQADALKEYNKLVGQKTALENQLSKTTSFTQSYLVLEHELERVEAQIKTVTSLMKNVKLPEGNVASLKNYTKDFANIEKGIDSLQNKWSKLRFQDNLPQGYADVLDRVKNSIRSLQEVDLSRILNADKPYETISNLIERIQEVKKYLDGLDDNINFAQKIGEQAKETKNHLNQLQSQMETFKKTKMFGDTTDLDKLIQRTKTLSNMKINFDSSNGEAKFKLLIQMAEKLEAEFAELQTKAKIDLKTSNLETSITKATNRLNELKTRYDALGKDTAPINKLINDLQGLNKVSFAEAESKLRVVNDQISTLSKRAKQSEDALKRVSSSANASAKATSRFVTNLYSTLSTYSLGNILGMQITKGIYAVKETIVGLDSAFRDLEKVAPASFTGTKKELQEVKEMAYQTGQEVARSSVDIINSTASAFQLGINNLKDAMEYAKNVNMYANVAETKFCLCL